MINLKSKAQEVRDRGYCVIESAYDDQECEEMRGIFDALCVKKGGLSSEQPSVGFHPLLEWGPEMSPYYAKSVLVDAMEEVLQDDVRLSHSGAAVFDNAHTNPFLTHWHVHYAWDIPDGGLQRENAERILCNIYVDGSSLDVGPLIVFPRQLNESVDRKDDVSVDWEGQDVVEVPPGAAVIFDTAVWHCSRRGSAKGIRRIWGGHYQGWNNPTPHPEDNTSDNPTLTEFRNELPLLRSLLDEPE